LQREENWAGTSSAFAERPSNPTCYLVKSHSIGGFCP